MHPYVQWSHLVQWSQFWVFIFGKVLTRADYLFWKVYWLKQGIYFGKYNSHIGPWFFILENILVRTRVFILERLCQLEPAYFILGNMFVSMPGYLF